MENTKKVFWALVLLVFATVLVISSCKKKQCYHCYSFTGSFRASKNGDTITVATYIQWSALFWDSVNYYKSQGYTIDNSIYQFNSDPLNGEISCDTNFDYPAVTIRDSCAPII